MRIFNTLTREKQEFVPVKEGKVGIYACGPTVYNFIHIGNARPLCVFDVLRRYLEWRGYEVTYVSNFTDIDDKLIRKANEEGITVPEVAERYIKEFWTDAEGLNVRHATVNPRATDHIAEIIDIISHLVENGYAYASNGDVYFRTLKFNEYGKLSHQPLEDLEAGARIDVAEIKENPMDFALWKGVKPGEPSWPSPWGEGRPGWHIECSAMSQKYIGETLDIHCGGQDLIFPHHENEIAQSECACGKPFSNYWMHNGYINVDNRKMSKSLGNFFLLRDILDKFDSETVRFYLLSVHYRSPLDFDDEKLQVAQKGLERMKNCYAAMTNALKTASAENTAEGAELVAKVNAIEDAFQDAMNDDFNTALASAALFDMAREINTYLKNEVLDKAALEKAAASYTALLNIMGLDFAAAGAVDDGLVDDLMNLLIDLRKQARAEKNYAMADQIRNQLNEIGVLLEDTKQGTTWKRK